MRLQRSSRSWSIECTISAASFTFAERFAATAASYVRHDANHWRDFRYPWPAAAAGARGACRLRSHHPCRGCWQPRRTCEARRAGTGPRRARKRRSRIEIDGFRIYVLHILAELDPQAADKVDAVIYGHSHQPKIETKNGTLFFNPGSAGPCRFRLPITVGRMTAEHGKLRAEIVELSIER